MSHRRRLPELLLSRCRRASGLSRTQDQHAFASMVRGLGCCRDAKLGEMFIAAGGKWEQTSIAGHTATTLATAKALTSGNAPPASSGARNRRMERNGHRLCAIERTNVPPAIEVADLFGDSLLVVAQVDVEAGGDRALRAQAEHGLELWRQNEVQGAGSDVVGSLEDRVRIEDEARLAPVVRRLRANAESGPSLSPAAVKMPICQSPMIMKTASFFAIMSAVVV